VRDRSPSLDHLQLFLVSRRACSRAAMSLASERFTNALLGRGPARKSDLVQSLLNAGRVCLRARVLVIAGRFVNELFICGLIRIVLNPGLRNSPFENDGWRKRAAENVRCGPLCSTLLMPPCVRNSLGLCGVLRCVASLGICAPAVNVSVKLPMQNKRLPFIISPLCNFLNQTPALGWSCAGREHTGLCSS
jgi:hypothetical protein